METDIVRWARQAGFTWEPINNIILPLERFAALVRADEREQCAKLCDAEFLYATTHDGARRCASAIRARGEK